MRRRKALRGAVRRSRTYAPWLADKGRLAALQLGHKAVAGLRQAQGGRSLQLVPEERKAGLRADRRADRQADGRADGRAEGRTDGRTGGKTDGQKGGQAHRQADGRTDGQADGRTDGRTGADGRMGVQADG